MKTLNQFDCLVKIDKPEDVPVDKHYTIIIYETVTRSEPSYDHAGQYDSYQALEVSHYVTKSSQVWKDEILRLEQKKEKYVAFVVDKIAKVKLNVSVDLDIK